MEISDHAAAASCLERIGYYRLSGYWYPFRKFTWRMDKAEKKPRRFVENSFQPGTSLQSVMDLYVYDKRLRLLFLDAIERVEVALRVDIALLLGARDPWAHRNPNHLHGRFWKRPDPKSGQNEFQKWLGKLDHAFDRSREEFALHFKRKYPGEQPPVWIAIELWDFGMLSVFLSGMKIADQQNLALKYGLPRPDLLTTWIRNMNHVRNICAHHSRLWNRSLADQIAPPKHGEIPLLNHLAHNQPAQSRLYATAATLQFLLRTIHPGSSWGARLKEHCMSFPTSAMVRLSESGFPQQWADLPLWKEFQSSFRNSAIDPPQSSPVWPTN